MDELKDIQGKICAVISETFYAAIKAIRNGDMPRDCHYKSYQHGIAFLADNMVYSFFDKDRKKTVEIIQTLIDDAIKRHKQAPLPENHKAIPDDLVSIADLSVQVAKQLLFGVGNIYRNPPEANGHTCDPKSYHAGVLYAMQHFLELCTNKPHDEVTTIMEQLDKEVVHEIRINDELVTKTKTQRPN